MEFSRYEYWSGLPFPSAGDLPNSGIEPGSLALQADSFNYIELVHNAFQVYYILLLFCIFILISFESLIMKLQLKILISLLKKLKFIVELYVILFSIF